MSELMDYWRQRIERDLSPFADPGTQLTAETAGNVIEVNWIQRRKSLTASIKISPVGKGLVVAFQGKQFDYRQFYASEAMCDLLGLAKMILQASKPAMYIDTEAVSEDGAGASEMQGPAIEIIRKSIVEEGVGTNLVMVTGEAGAGKTSVLKQLVRSTADDYVGKQCDFLLLYIDAQGRALARFSEALATELQDLRVNLTYHGISTLVRLGLIVPVIDGFDELIGVGGYDDAFSSISSFIEELDGLGSVLASARSTYYEHEFLSRANRVSALGAQAWRLRSIAVKAWGESQRDKYVDSKAGSLDAAGKSAIAQKVRKIFAGENEALGNKPLFVARTVDALLTGAELSGDGALLDKLVEVFLTREQTEKLLGRGGKPLVSRSQLIDLYADLAEEMWNQATRELDKNSARDLAELALLDTDLRAPDKQVVAERMATLAFLQPGESVGSIAFEHEIFFGYFLASSLVKKIREHSTGVPLLLSRSVLPESLADAAAKILIQESNMFIGAITAQLCGAASARSLKQAQVQENAALLVAALLKEAGKQQDQFRDLAFNDLVFPGASLRGLKFCQCAFNRVTFRRTEFCGTEFENCDSTDSRFYSVLVDRRTKLNFRDGVDLVAFTGLDVLEESGRVRQLFDPSDIKAELAKMGLPAAQGEKDQESRKVDDHIVDLIERFSRTYQKRNPVCVDEEFLFGIFGDGSWPAVQRILLSTGLVRQETRQAHGPKRTFLRRMVNYQDIPAGSRRDAKVPAEVHRFWDEIEKKFPAH